ncbi:MAG TPA: HAD family phosphatase [Candidatus Limnocylindrales bacterium]|nr:HAD family phosphatase [Candidatus Limnocylindrales bacterium]
MPQPDFDPAAIRAAVFDYGGVLIEGGPREVVAFGLKCGLTEDVWKPLRRRIFGNEGRWAELERGEISFQTFIDELREEVEKAGGNVDAATAAAFMGDPEPMAQKMRLRTEVIDAVSRIRRRMPTALLTNNIVEWRADWQGLLDIPSLFDVVIDSSAVGCRKPEPRIYEITQQRLGVPHQQIFFVDDIGQNLKAARALGWKTLLFTEPGEVLPVLHALVTGDNHRRPR